MLSKRYINNGKPILKLNKMQLLKKKSIEIKIKSEIYKFENIKCDICNNSEFVLLGEKDRYGLPVKTVICKECGLIQTNPRMTQESYNDFYNFEYRGLHHSDSTSIKSYFEAEIIRGREILKFIENKIEKKIEDKFVVEIGAGAGGILKAFKEKGNKVFGVDLGEKFINYGKENGIDLEVGTIDRLVSNKKKADLIIYSHVMEHTLSPYEELLKVKECLKEDGVLYIEVPGVKFLGNKKNTYKPDLLMSLQKAHIFHFSLNSLRNLANKAGFNLIYGNEEIKAILKIGKVNNFFKNDYTDTMNFLIELENKLMEKL